MSRPSIAVEVEPFEDGAVVYAPMAAPANGGQEQGRLMLRLTIESSEPTTIQMQDLRVLLSGPGVYPAPTIGLVWSWSAGSTGGSAPLTIAPGETVTWWFQSAADGILFPLVNAPTDVRLELRASGFSDPAVLTRPLRPHAAPTPTNAYRFPAATPNPRDDEYWYGHGITHALAGDGSQTFAYDLGVRGSGVEKPWLKPDTDGTENEHFRIWGKGIHAMADGEVVHALTDVPTNPRPLPGKNWDAELAAQKAAVWGPFEADFGGAGNHLYVRHDTETVLYAHLQPGSIPAPLLIVGASVRAGDLLGLAGNSGNSTSPHLHVHARRGDVPESGPPRPLVFAPVAYVESSLVSHAPVPWAQAVAGRSLPPVEALIWPSVPPPYKRLPGKAVIDPLSLLLSDHVYVILNLPRPPEVGILIGLIEQIVAGASPAESREALKRVARIITTLQAVSESLAGEIGVLGDSTES